MKKPVIFIDGDAGTTGLEIRRDLSGHEDIEMVSIHPDRKRDTEERRRLLNACDLAILCQPDEAARDAVAMIENPDVKILDASTVHRTDPDWVYGFPELTPGQLHAVRNARQVSNPGSYPTGVAALLRPLTDAGIVPRDYAATIMAVSGYSGGGRELIALCEHHDGGERASAFCLYGLDQHHRHVPEMCLHSGLDRAPIFLPSYSKSFYRGLLVTVPLRLDDLPAGASAEAMHAIFLRHYEGHGHMRIEPVEAHLDKHHVVTPLALNETNDIQIRIFPSADRRVVILTACLDNLGKGAAGAALQNAELMLGLPPSQAQSDFHQARRS